MKDFLNNNIGMVLTKDPLMSKSDTQSCVVRRMRIDSSKRIGYLSLFMEVGIYHLPICSQWAPIMIVFMPIVTFLLT